MSFRVDPVEVQFTGSQMAQVADDLESQAAPLRREAATLLGGSWQGVAASGFRAGYDEWDAGLTNVITALREFGEQTSAAGRAYAGSDEDADAAITAAGRAL